MESVQKVVQRFLNGDYVITTGFKKKNIMELSAVELIEELRIGFPLDAFTFIYSVYFIAGMSKDKVATLVDALSASINNGTEMDWNIYENIGVGLIAIAIDEIQIYNKFSARGIPVITIDNGETWIGFYEGLHRLQLEMWMNKMYRIFLIQLSALAPEKYSTYSEAALQFKEEYYTWGLYTPQGKDLHICGNPYQVDKRRPRNILRECCRISQKLKTAVLNIEEINTEINKDVVGGEIEENFIEAEVIKDDGESLIISLSVGQSTTLDEELLTVLQIAKKFSSKEFKFNDRTVDWANLSSSQLQAELIKGISLGANAISRNTNFIVMMIKLMKNIDRDQIYKFVQSITTSISSGLTKINNPHNIENIYYIGSQSLNVKGYKYKLGSVIFKYGEDKFIIGDGGEIKKGGAKDFAFIIYRGLVELIVRNKDIEFLKNDFRTMNLYKIDADNITKIESWVFNDEPTIYIKQKIENAKKVVQKQEELRVPDRGLDPWSPSTGFNIIPKQPEVVPKQLIVASNVEKLKPAPSPLFTSPVTTRSTPVPAPTSPFSSTSHPTIWPPVPSFPPWTSMPVPPWVESLKELDRSLRSVREELEELKSRGKKRPHDITSDDTEIKRPNKRKKE